MRTRSPSQSNVQHCPASKHDFIFDSGSLLNLFKRFPVLNLYQVQYPPLVSRAFVVKEDGLDSLTGGEGPAGGQIHWFAVAAAVRQN